MPRDRGQVLSAAPAGGYGLNVAAYRPRFASKPALTPARTGGAPDACNTELERRGNVLDIPAY